MRGVFVDTAGWVACADGADPAHEAARAARDEVLRRGQVLLTTDYVVDETLTLLRIRLGLDAAEAWWRQVDGSPRVHWEWVGPARAERAHDAFFRHRDKKWSFTDCTSLVVMRECRLRVVLTTDRHFAQMGFSLLPGPTPARSRRPR